MNRKTLLAFAATFAVIAVSWTLPAASASCGGVALYNASYQPAAPVVTSDRPVIEATFYRVGHNAPFPASILSDNDNLCGLVVIHATLDGAHVTPSWTYTNDGGYRVTYQPASALTMGPHTFQLVVAEPCCNYAEAIGNLGTANIFFVVSVGNPVGDLPALAPAQADDRDGTCTTWNDTNRNGVRDASEPGLTALCPDPQIHTRPDGKRTIYDDKDDDRTLDQGEEVLTAGFVDNDQDGLDDDLEKEMCGPGLVGTALKTADERGVRFGQCANQSDFQPFHVYHGFVLITGVVPGPDADADGFASNLVFKQMILYADPFMPGLYKTEPWPDYVVAVDPNDADRQTPLVSSVTVPGEYITGYTRGPDNDGDGMPASLTLHKSTITFDRGNPATPTYALGPAGSQTYAPDPDDGNPNVPVQRIFTLPGGLPGLPQRGADADNDGAPAHIGVTYNTLTFDSRTASLTSAPGATQTQQIDPNDADPNVPAQSVFTLPPIYGGHTLGPDADNDNVRESVTVTSTAYTWDRRNPGVLTPTPGPTQTRQLDPNDADPNVPAQRIVTASVPVGATGRDYDGDYLPGTVTITYLQVTADTTKPGGGTVTTTTYTYTRPVDDNDAQRGYGPINLDATDADRDLVPDALEPTICANIENPNRDRDGSCPSSTNWQPPTTVEGVPVPPLPSPWSRS